MSDVSFQLKRTLLLAILVTSTVEASIEVLEFFPDFRDNSFVVVLRLFQTVSLFIQLGFRIADRVLERRCGG